MYARRASITVPDHLPPLVKGIGSSPVTGGCLVQVTNYLAKGTWSDGPEGNVMPALVRLAITVNDGVCDRHRQALWPLVPRLMKTFNDVTDVVCAINDLVEPMTFQLSSYVHQRGSKGQRCDVNGVDDGGCSALIFELSRALNIYDHLVGRLVGSITDVDWRPLSPEALGQLTDEEISRLKSQGSFAMISLESYLLSYQAAMVKLHLQTKHMSYGLTELRNDINKMNAAVEASVDREDDDFWSPEDVGVIMKAFDKVSAVVSVG